MEKSQRKKSVAIVGSNGYSGLELARLLLQHPEAELKGCFARDPKWRLSDELPELAAQGVPTWHVDALPARASELDTVFLATPVEGSMEAVARIIGIGATVIDLSGAFRLELKDFEKWYGVGHSVPAQIPLASYGLTPWAALRDPRSSRLTANPGCFATSVLMGILPLLKADLIRPETLVIDAKSGTSGAGRKAQERLLFTEVDGNCLPYRVGGHQHLPEIIRHTRLLAGVEIDPIFTTSLLPARRGILSSIYARLRPEVAALSSPEANELIARAYAAAYDEYPLVRVERLGKSESSDTAVLSLRRVVGSARTHIGFHAGGDKLCVFSSIDNLLKGAAGQAVENFNFVNGLEISSGLLQKEGTL